MNGMELYMGVSNPWNSNCVILWNKYLVGWIVTDRNAERDYAYLDSPTGRCPTDKITWKSRNGVLENARVFAHSGKIRILISTFF